MGIFDIEPPSGWRNLFPFVEDGPSCGLSLLGFVVFVVVVLVLKHFLFG
jgi:hypothetical protein